MYSLFSKSKEIGLKQDETIFKNPINATSRPCNARTGLSFFIWYAEAAPLTNQSS